MLNMSRRKWFQLIILIIVVQLSLVVIYPNVVSIFKSSTEDSLIGTTTWRLTRLESSTGSGNQIKKWTRTGNDYQSSGNLEDEKQHYTFLLLQRNLLLFSIREVNLKVAGTGCSKWWANPLSINEIEEAKLSTNVTQHTLRFEAQPGRISFETVVNVHRNYPSREQKYVSDDFEFVSGRRLDEVKQCIDTSRIPKHLRNICLCPEERVAAESKTKAIRKRWNKVDPEHPHWPPDASAMVPDFLTLGKLDKYIKTPDSKDVCGPNVDLLIFISSAPSHVERREAIRQTFGNETYLRQRRVRLLFSFARFEDIKTYTEYDVDLEFAKYGDILQSDFADHYQNQSLIELFFYNWLVSHCDMKQSPLPVWLLKADDDSFLNVPLILRIAKANPEAEIIGCQLCPHAVQRLWKAQVPKYMYGPTHWFGFIFGGAELMKTDILQPLLKASLTCPIVNMNDCYITGVLAKQIGVMARNSPLFQTSLIVRETSCSKPKFMANTYIEESEDIEVQWRNLHKAKPTEHDCKFDDKKLLVDPLSRQTRLKCFYD